MPSQKALSITAVKGELLVVNRTIPEPLPGNVVVKNFASALNPADWKIHHGYLVDSFPTTAGFDAAGTVEVVGRDVAQWKVGDRVLYQGAFGTEKTTFQQYTTVPADVIGRLPENISFDAGSTVPTGVVTAAAGLYQYKGSDSAPSFTPPWFPGGEGKYAGKSKSIVILGGSSSVGQYAIQLARLSGFSPIIATASPHNETLVKSLGATHFVNRSSPALVADVLSILTTFSAEKASLVFDAVSEKSTQEAGIEIIGPNGVLVIILKSVHDAEKVKEAKKHIFHPTGIAQLPHLRDFAHGLFAALPTLLEEKKITPNAFEVLPGGLSGVEAGFEALSQNKVSGKKLVAHPSDER